MNRDQPLLSVEDLKVYFRSEKTVSKAVDGVSFNVMPREMVCIVGESGCGKTVTALTLLGLIDTPPGEIAGGNALFGDTELLKASSEKMQKIRGDKIAMVFQEPLTALNPVFTVGDQLEEAVRTHKDISDKDLEAKCIQLFRDVGIPEPEKRLKAFPHQLSGGQRQRVMIAMALSCDPELIIADEPTTALDVTVQAQILDLFTELQKQRGLSVLYITHDLGVVATIARRVYVMYAGTVIEEGKTEQIFSTPHHPYTIGLLASLPSRNKRTGRLYNIPGSVPDPAYKPPGCPFHPRCKIAVDTCRSLFPQYCDYGKGHRARCPVLHEDPSALNGISRKD